MKKEGALKEDEDLVATVRKNGEEGQQKRYPMQYLNHRLYNLIQ